MLLLLSHFSCVQLCVTPQTAAHQAPPPLGFSRQEHWSGAPLPSLYYNILRHNSICYTVKWKLITFCKGNVPLAEVKYFFLVAQLVKNLPATWETGFDPWVGKIPWRREGLPTPVFWPGEFHGLYVHPQGCKESDTTEQLSLLLSGFHRLLQR